MLRLGEPWGVAAGFSPAQCLTHATREFSIGAFTTTTVNVASTAGGTCLYRPSE